MNLPHRVYIAGPFSGDTLANTNRAIAAGIEVAVRGHWVHIPHSHTAPMHGLFPYEWFMDLDRTYIENWATALLYLAPSPGADRELEWARELELTVWMSVDEVPNVV